MVAISRGSQVVVQFLDGEAGQGGQEVAARLDGAPIQALASDGDAVLILGTHPAEADADPGPGAPFVLAALVRPSGPESFALGLRAVAPTLYGDDSGFVVDGAWLISAGFGRARAPGPQVPGLRLFRRTGPSGDAVTVDGTSWLELDAPLAAAFADPRGLEWWSAAASCMSVPRSPSRARRSRSRSRARAAPFCAGSRAIARCGRRSTIPTICSRSWTARR